MLKKQNNKYKHDVVFFGTPEFAVPSLLSLIDSDKFNIVAVVTQPDKKVGRSQNIIHSPVKGIALKNNIKVLQPKKIDKIFIEKMKDLQPDINLVIAYGKILPKELLDIPKYKSINIHGSLLPQYRGASPMQAAIINGDAKTGITFMVMNENMDEGDIIKKYEVEIKKGEGIENLHDRLSSLAAETIISVLNNWIEGKIKAQKQDDSKATYTKIMKREDGYIDWKENAENIYRKYLAYHPWPGLYMKNKINNKDIRIKLLEIKVGDIENCNKKAGEMFFENCNLYVATEDKKAIMLNVVQPEGKKPMSGSEFYSGYGNLIKNNGQKKDKT